MTSVMSRNKCVRPSQCFSHILTAFIFLLLETEHFSLITYRFDLRPDHMPRKFHVGFRMVYRVVKLTHTQTLLRKAVYIASWLRFRCADDHRIKPCFLWHVSRFIRLRQRSRFTSWLQATRHNEIMCKQKLNRTSVASKRAHPHCAELDGRQLITDRRRRAAYRDNN